MNLIEKATSTVLFTALTACGLNPMPSKQAGHFERKPSYQNKQAGKLEIYPEYQPHNAVAVSYAVVGEYQNFELLKAIKDSGAKVLMALPKEHQTDPKVLRRVVDELGNDHISFVNMESDESPVVWARDWGPLMTRNPNQDEFYFVDVNYHIDRPVGDEFPRVLDEMQLGKRLSLPVYNEGGNFMANSRGECLMSSIVLDYNAWKILDNDLVLDEKEIADTYKKMAGCREVIMLPEMPHEGTGHIDIWAKFLNDDVILLNEISHESLALMERKARRSWRPVYRKMLKATRDIRSFLAKMKTKLEEKGYTVVTIPMPIPDTSLRDPNEINADSLYRSYTNALILNGRVLVPRFTKSEGRKYVDHELTKFYERRVRWAYEIAGYEVVFIDADALIQDGGGLASWL